MNINLIEEINALAKGTKESRKELWAKAVELKVDNRNMYLYSTERLKALTGEAQKAVDEKAKAEEQAKAEEEKRFKEFVTNDPRSIELNKKFKEAKEEDRKDIMKEAQELMKTLKKEFKAKAA